MMTINPEKIPGVSKNILFLTIYQPNPPVDPIAQKNISALITARKALAHPVFNPEIKLGIIPGKYI